MPSEIIPTKKIPTYGEKKRKWKRCLLDILRSRFDPVNKAEHIDDAVEYLETELKDEESLLLRTFHDVSNFGTIPNEEFIAFVITNIDSNIFDAVNILINQALQWGCNC